MLLPLVYYLTAFLVYVLLYGYYKNNNKKKSAKLDFIQKLESSPLPPAPIANRKPFDQIKRDVSTYFYFERIRIIFGIDLSASNEWKGKKTFQGQSLHKTQGNKIFNPYQKAISQLGMLFQDVFATKNIEYSSFGFGDEVSKDYTFFPIVGTGEGFNQYQLVLDAYLQQTKNIVLSGPTAFTPIIKKLISYGFHCKKDFAILVILTDDLKVSHEDTILVESLRVLTCLPNICLSVIGVGDGPWQRMSYEEHRLRELAFKRLKKKTVEKLPDDVNRSRIYDNFHFVDLNNFTAKSDKPDIDYSFARAVLAKLPTHLKQAYLDNKAQLKTQAQAQPQTEIQT